MHTRECLNANLPIYKIGRSHNLGKRVKQYPTGSNIMFIIYCNNSIVCEKNLIQLFTKLFIRKKNYGNEYFEGDIDMMIFTIFKYLYKDKFKNNNKLKSIYNIESLEKVIEVNKVNKANEIVKVNKVVEHKDRTCPDCIKIFKYPSGLKKHLEASYNCKKDKTDIDLYFCNIKIDNINKNMCNKCNILFPKNYLLLRHKKICDKSNFSNISNTSNVLTINKDQQLQNLKDKIQKLKEQVQTTKTKK